MKNIVDVSVVVPCYNCAETVSRAYASIEAQSVLPREVVFVDDCSSDTTAEVIKRIKKSSTLDVVIVTLDSNSGASTARNVGLDTANYDLIAFLDSDDTWAVEKLARQVALMSSDESIVLSGHLVKQLKGAIVENSDLQVRGNVKVLSVWDLLIKNYFNTPSVMIRKTSKRFYSGYRHAEDYAMWLNIANNGGKVVFLNSTLAYVYKPFYGHSGLSESLQLMHKAEVTVLRDFLKENYPYAFVLWPVLLWVKIKYFKRIFLLKFIL